MGDDELQTGDVGKHQRLAQDQRRLLPCAAHLTGQYGVSDLYVGVPTIIGKGGVERIVEIALAPDEQAMFDKSVAAVKSLCDAVKL